MTNTSNKFQIAGLTVSGEVLDLLREVGMSDGRQVRIDVENTRKGGDIALDLLRIDCVTGASEDRIPIWEEYLAAVAIAAADPVTAHFCNACGVSVDAGGNGCECPEPSGDYASVVTP